MSTYNYDISQISKRIISLSALFPTAKAFLEKCDISNPSVITDLKKGRVKAPSAEILSQIVRGTGCSGSWLLTGEGEMFSEKTINDQMPNDRAILEYALTLLSKLKHKPDMLEGIKLTTRSEIILTETLLAILKFRRKVE